jgi:hypothetical protein
MMPLALDPNASVWVCLKSDEDKPKETRPEFRVKVQSMRGQIALMEFVTEMTSLNTQKELCDVLDAKLSELIIETRNLPEMAIVDMLTDTEAIELIYTIRDAGRLANEQRKKSESPQPSGGELSAKDALLSV